MPSFSVGDRVIMPNNEYQSLVPEGTTGTVTRTDGSHTWVEWDVPTEDTKSPWGSSSLAHLIEPTPTTHPYPTGTRVHVASERWGILPGSVMGYPVGDTLAVDVLIDDEHLPAELEENPCRWHRYKVRPIGDVPEPYTLTVTLPLSSADAESIDISDMGQVIDYIAETWPALRVRIESNE